MTGEAPYQRIVADIRRRIADGALTSGDKVPSTRQLVADYGVAMATATKALTTLRQAGLVRPVPGVGTVVSEPDPAPPARRRAARTGPGPARDEVVRAAMALADAEGLPGVSMRRIATELGIATMSLYRYVAGRDELVTLMLDAAISEFRLPAEAPDGWRARVETSARTMWRACRRHPWLAQALSMTRPQALPHGMDHTEWMLAAFTGFGLDLDTRMHLCVTVLMYVRGVAVNIEPQLHAEQDSGLTDEEWMDRQKPTMLAVTDPARHPHLSTAMADEVDMTLDSLFEFGLRRLLDGYAALLEPRG